MNLINPFNSLKNFLTSPSIYLFCFHTQILFSGVQSRFESNSGLQHCSNVRKPFWNTHLSDGNWVGKVQRKLVFLSPPFEEVCARFWENPTSYIDESSRRLTKQSSYPTPFCYCCVIINLLKVLNFRIYLKKKQKQNTITYPRARAIELCEKPKKLNLPPTSTRNGLWLLNHYHKMMQDLPLLWYNNAFVPFTLAVCD